MLQIYLNICSKFKVSNSVVHPWDVVQCKRPSQSRTAIHQLSERTMRYSDNTREIWGFFCQGLWTEGLSLGGQHGQWRTALLVL